MNLVLRDPHCSPHAVFFGEKKPWMGTARFPVSRAWIPLVTLAAAFLAQAEEHTSETQPPEAWKTWVEAKYATRYFLEVLQPPKEGAIHLQPPHATGVATLILPLKQFPLPAPPVGETQDEDTPTQRTEDVLLLDDLGAVQPVLVRAVKGGNEFQVAFPCPEGRRRYCLYSDAPQDSHPQASPPVFVPKAIRVRATAFEAPVGFGPQKGRPLTLVDVQNFTRDAERLREDLRTHINDAEPFVPPYLDDPSKQKPRLRNLAQYVSMYEGFVRTPLAGAYTFAVSTFGAAYLLVDGELVIAAGEADAARLPHALNAKKDLSAGMHRIVLYHAQGGDKTGVGVQWQPPGTQDLLTIPPQSFPRGLPATVRRKEARPGVVGATPAQQACLDVELLGQYRTGAHHGNQATREWIWVFARGVGPNITPEHRIRLTPRGAAPVEVPVSGGCAWLEAGQDITAELWAKDGAALATRTLRFPSAAAGARDVELLSGELEVKATPRFVYSDEIAQLHLEVQLNSLPLVSAKERVTNGPQRQPPTPDGQLRFSWKLTGPASSGATDAGTSEATPDAMGRRKVRVPLDARAIEVAARSGQARLELTLTVGGVPAERLVFRLLHARAVWPAAVRAELDGLAWGPIGTEQERVLIVVPREDEAEYRRFRPLGLQGVLSDASAAKSALFLGDPWVEVADPSKPQGEIGLATRLAAGMPQLKWTAVALPGPHRGHFIFRLIAATEAWLNAQGAAQLPDLALVSLGNADAGQQTPLHDFERGLDVLVDRLRRAGIQRILILGIVPEPGRLEQSRAYRDQLNEILRQHHLESIDILGEWTKDPTWTQHFALDPTGRAPVFAPVPNAASLDDLVERVKAKLK